ncbi:unnamed protein product [Clonostachys rhizophaga]|uniref:Heme haloperoxidase family profile domain-containing protein n=1 Tax=Clonostachys rhizophaga TaxID=160324 RepID=A0A9N9YKS6_9HYPO|nr:unnamed protein product [Clonostachys rhizophaga]
MAMLFIFELDDVLTLIDIVDLVFGHFESLEDMLLQKAFSLLGKELIDLEEPNAHGITEHDASLTWEDFPGDSLHVNIDQLNALLADTSDSYLSVASLVRSRNRVEALSPPLTAAFKGQSLGEAALILMIMSQDPIPPTGTAEDYGRLRAPKDRVSLWLSYERLPVEAGWSAPSHPFWPRHWA